MTISSFDLGALKAALSGTIFAGQLHFSPITDSTNTDGLKAANQGAPHGSVFFADEQSAGRGRGGHAWESAAGQGLYVSVLLRPRMPATRLALLPLAAGLAAADAIHETTSLDVDIRWPNDLLIGPRKAGGILVEAKTGSRGTFYAVVGIGINVHQRAFAEGLSTPATSLDLEAGRPIDRQALLVSLLRALEREAHALVEEASAKSIPGRVQLASTWVSGRSVHVHGPQACTGVTEGLDGNGFLLVRTAAGLATVQTGGLREAETDEPGQPA